jgi:predicted acyl esterase
MAEEKKSWIDLLLDKSRAEFSQLPAEPIHETCRVEEFMLPMPDGAALATYIRKPVGDGPFPTIAMRSCYPHQDPLLQLYAAEYSRRGFAFVWQYCRGTGLFKVNGFPI